MPQVPRYDGPQVAATTNPAPMLSGGIVASENYAARQTEQLGHGMQQLGGTLAQIAVTEQRRANETVAKDIDQATTKRLNDLLFDPDAGFMSKQGKDTIFTRDDYQKRVEQIGKEALESVPNAAIREFVAPTIAARMQHATDSMNRHSAQEGRRYQIQTSQSRAEVTMQDAAMNYGDEKRFADAVGVAKYEAQAQAQLQGWDENTTRLQAQKYVDTAYRMRYEAWHGKDPVGAFTHFVRNGEQISPIMRDQIGRELFQHAAPVLAAQINQGGGVGVVEAAPGEGPLPRGIRNNNPGNLMRSTTPWEGEVNGNDPRYASFGSPEAGIRAMGKTLLAYQDRHGLNTIEGIVSRYAPATENDTAAYVATVAKEIGVKADAPLDLHNTDTLTKLTRAMIRVENGPGASRITDQQITAGLAAATGGASVPSPQAMPRRDPNFQTGNTLVDVLPPDWKLHVLQLARSQAHQDMAEAREQLRGKLQDATAEYMAKGFATNPPNEGEFVRAFGQADGPARYRDFQNTAVLGQTLQQVKTLPNEALVNLVESSKPTMGDGFAARQHNYEILTSAVQQVQQARAKDPVAYALSINAYGIKPITRLDDPQALQGELSARAAAALQMAKDYGTPPALLTKDEARSVSATLKASPVEAQKGVLATLYKGVGDLGLFKHAMQAISPDNPTAAVAGIYQARGLQTNQGQDVADLILRGQAILTPNKKEDGTGHAGGAALIKMPEEKLLLSDWNSATGDAFKGKEQASDLFMQTARAIYAARSAEEGDYSGVINSKRWKASIMLATGGIESHNGNKIVMPYGVGYDQFQNTLQARVDKLVTGGEVLNAGAHEMMRLPLENVGDGRYLFRRGTGYLVSKDGRPVVVDLNGGR